MQSFEKGRNSDVSCACHWTVDVARLEGQRPALCATSIRWRRPACSCRRIRRSRRRRISPACRSRSATSPAATTRPSRRSSSTCRRTRSTCPSPTACCSSAWSCCSTARCRRATLFRGPYYFAEQLGFRKIIDTTFMIATMITRRSRSGGPAQIFPRAAGARSATSICGRSSTRTTTRTNSRCAITPVMDTRRWGPGERLVFEPYTKEVYEETFKWIADHGIFADSGMGSGKRTRRPSSARRVELDRDRTDATLRRTPAASSIRSEIPFGQRTRRYCHSSDGRTADQVAATRSPIRRSSVA